MSAIHAGLAAADPVSVSRGPGADLLWSAPDDEDPDIPDTLGGVRITHMIGEGGMGRVYLGHHPVLDVDVAVKVMSGHGDRARFLTEARLAAKVQHENIVRILHAGDERGYRYLVLEFVSGSNLKQVLAERGLIPWKQAAGYILQAASGLAAAHRLGIIHRDIKPSNLLLSAQERIKVADLGVARTLLGDSDSTATGSVIGTPAYMAPEQARDPHNVTPAADVYGLGATFYCLVTGQPPFPGLSFAEMLATHKSGKLPDPRTVVPDLPAHVVEVMHRLLAKEAWARPADGADAVKELERMLGLATVSTASPYPPAATEAPMRRWWIAAAACLGLGSFLLLGSGMPGHPTPPTPTAVQADAPPHPLPAAAAPADSWQTPPRAVFLLADRLPAATIAGIDAACTASGLPVVERQRLETLVREQDLLSGGRVDPATAGRLGRLVGGHIAIFAAAVEDRIELRTVLVETGELVACRLVAPDQAEPAVAAALASATGQLPVQTRVSAIDSTLRLAAGARHGLRVGDRLELRRTAGAAPFAVVTVSAVEAARSTCTAAGAVDADGALASRIAP
jgi:predicted Ser/Thr protein kinase